MSSMSFSIPQWSVPRAGAGGMPSDSVLFDPWASPDMSRWGQSPQLNSNYLTGGNYLTQGSPAVNGGMSNGSDWGNIGGVPFFGNANQQGWGGMAMGAIGGLAQGFMGMKQYGLAKKTLEESKRQFQLNYDAQRDSTNTQLEDRQRARVGSNGGQGTYESVGTYMDRNRIK